MVGQLTRKWFEKPWSLGIHDNDCGNRSIFMKIDGASAFKFAVCFLLSCLPSSSASPALRQTNFLLFKSPKLLASRRSPRLICLPLCAAILAVFQLAVILLRDPDCPTEHAFRRIEIQLCCDGLDGVGEFNVYIPVSCRVAPSAALFLRFALVVASTTWHSSLASDGIDACETPYNIFLEYLDRDKL